MQSQSQESKRVIPESAISKGQLDAFFTAISETLEKNDLNRTIFHLFSLNNFFERNLKPIIQEGKPTVTKYFVFSCTDAIQLLLNDFPNLQKEYNYTIRRNGAILLEILQNCLERAAARDNAAEITLFVICSNMLKVFAGVTKTDFFVGIDLNLEKDVDPLIPQWNLSANIPTIIAPIVPPDRLAFFKKAQQAAELSMNHFFQTCSKNRC